MSKWMDKRFSRTLENTLGSATILHNDFFPIREISLYLKGSAGEWRAVVSLSVHVNIRHPLKQ